MGQLASYLLLAWEPACSRRLLPSHLTPQRHAWAVSSLPFPTQRPYRASLLLPRPRNLRRQHQRRQQPNLRPRRQVTRTEKKASSHFITDVFLTAFHSIPSSDSASEAPLYLESEHEATDKKTSLRSAAQQNTQTQGDPAKLFLLISCEVPCAVADSHSYQLLTTVHPNTKFRAFFAGFAVCQVSPKVQILCSDYYSVHKDERFCL